MPRPAPSQAWRTGAAEEVLPVQGDARATAGRTIGRAVPREEDVTFASGSRGMRMEKGRGAAAAGQPLYIRAGRLSDPGRGRVGKEWTTVEPDSENKLVRVSGGTSRACFFR
jgi:hypothetical protein